LDRAKKAGQAEPKQSEAPPASDEEWKERLHATLMEIGMAFTADAVEHSMVVASAAELQFTCREEYMLAMQPDDINQAVKRIAGRPMKIRIAPGAAKMASAPAPGPKPPEDETSSRALSNPEVKRFQEVFGGQVRQVRNLKE